MLLLFPGISPPWRRCLLIGRYSEVSLRKLIRLCDSTRTVDRIARGVSPVVRINWMCDLIVERRGGRWLSRSPVYNVQGSDIVSCPRSPLASDTHYSLYIDHTVVWLSAYLFPFLVEPVSSTVRSSISRACFSLFLKPPRNVGCTSLLLLA
jgi:hypothetical protein